ncbi:hypothetical protein BJ166DRAFT_588370 [Pestalotiopsis sp. NC0098]|nr:hypothetical protein BJ166DRAFT_588370 [Pestalotiopsis sp. NC0098]
MASALGSAQVRARRRVSAAKQGIRGALQCLWALIVITSFVVAVLAGVGAIKVPTWGKSLSTYSKHDQQVYGGALMGAVCVVFAILCVVGVFLQRQEARANAAMSRISRV